MSDGDGGPEFTLSERLRSHIHHSWEGTVIVKLWGKTIGYQMLTARIKALWKPTAAFCIIGLENNYHFVRFASHSDYLSSLVNGPWVVMAHYLTVQRWYVSFRAETHKISSVVAWVRLPSMPSELYHKVVLRAIGDQVGKTIRIGYNTQKATRGKFA